MMSLPVQFPLIENVALQNWWPNPRDEVPFENSLAMPLWNLEALVLDVSYMFAENFTQAHQNRKAIDIAMDQSRRIVRFEFNGHQFVQHEGLHALNMYILRIDLASLQRLHIHYGNNNQTFRRL